MLGTIVHPTATRRQAARPDGATRKSAWKHGYRDALASRPATPHLALNADAYSDGYDEGVTDRDIYEG